MEHPIAENENGATFTSRRIPALTYVLDEVHSRAVRRLRSALRRDGLQVVAEMDLGDTIRHELGLELASCRVLCVACPYLLLQAIVTDAATATRVPLHIVLAEDGRRTRIHLPTAPRTYGGAAASLDGKVDELVHRIVRCLESAGAYRG